MATAWQAITTCNKPLWHNYGRAMVETFERFWAPEIHLTVYAEGFAGDQNGRVNFVDLDQAAPWLAPWKAKRTSTQRGMTRHGYRYRWDAVKFSHKIAALSAAADQAEDGTIIWLDADIVTHAPVTVDWLDNLFPAVADIAWLDRERYYPECGFLMFRLPSCGPVIRRIVAAYQTGDIFKLQQWHDSYVIETICTAARATHGLRIASLSGDARGTHHPLAGGPLGACLDHLKGDRKSAGRSREFVGRRSEPYWR